MLLWLSLLLAQLQPAQDRQVPLFVVATADGHAKVGQVDAFQADFTVKLSQPDATVAAGELVAMRQVGMALPSRPATHSQLVFVNGDAIVMDRLISADDLLLEAAVELGPRSVQQQVKLPITNLRTIWFKAQPEGSTPGWENPNPKADTLVLQNGDMIAGQFLRINDARTVQFKPSGEVNPRSYELQSVRGLAFNPTLSRLRPPKTAYAHVVTANGSRLSLQKLQLDNMKLSATLPNGAAVLLDWHDCVALTVLQGPAVYLNELTPTLAEFKPFGQVNWPMQRNLSVKGNPLRLKGDHGQDEYDRGLGLHSHTELRYNLAGGYSRFESLVGLDANTGRSGNVALQIFVDDKDVTPKNVTQLNLRSGTVFLGVDVAEAKELRLIVQYGPGGDVQDDVNFAEPRLIKAKKK